MTKRKVRVPPLSVVGQTEAGWELPQVDPDPSKFYTCRECGSRSVAGPVVRTIDPRWVVATCLAESDRAIFDVTDRPPA